MAAIQKVSGYVLENEAEFIEQMQNRWKAQQAQTSDDDRKELADIGRRIDELDILIKGLYESNMLGKLPDRQYGEYQKARRDMQEIVTIKANIDTLLGYTEPGRKQEKER